MTNLSIEKIKSMSESDWNKIRKEEWENNKKKYDGPAPTFFMPNKDKYVDFITMQEKKNLKLGKKFTINVEEISKMNESEWNKFREKRWLEKGKSFSGDVPEWYMKKEQYLEFLSKKH